VNVVYLIGNGFDLNLGLKTSYRDFYHYYIARESKSLAVQKFKSSISEDISKWSDLEVELGRYTKNLTSLEELDDIHESVVDELADYLEKEQEHFISEKQSQINVETFKKYLFHPENSLKQRDSNALKTFYKGSKSNQYHIINFNYTHIIEHILGLDTASNLNQGLRVVLQEGNKSHHLVSTLHIHGSVNTDMVLGVDRQNQILNEKFSTDNEARNQLIKPNCNLVMRHNVDSHCEQLISKADLICIFGSSLGKTDQCWCDLIAKQLKNRECKLVIYQHEAEFNPRRSHLQDRVRTKTLLNFFKAEEIEKIEDNVHFALNSKMFDLLKS